MCNGKRQDVDTNTYLDTLKSDTNGKKIKEDRKALEICAAQHTSYAGSKSSEPQTHGCVVYHHPGQQLGLTLDMKTVPERSTAGPYCTGWSLTLGV